MFGRRTMRLVPAFVFALLFVTTMPAWAQTRAAPEHYSKDESHVIRAEGNYSLIAQIKDHFDFFEKEVVEVSGTVTARAPGEKGWYMLRDAFGHEIVIHTQESETLPVGQAASIRGTLRSRGSSPYIDKFLDDSKVPPTNADGMMSPLLLVLGAAALVLIVIIIILLLMFGRSDKRSGTGASVTPDLTPQPGVTPSDGDAQPTTYATTKISKDSATTIAQPNPFATVKHRPGSFTIVSGSSDGNGKSIQLYGDVTTIGRGDGAGDPLTHIGFAEDMRAISHNQAVVQYDGNERAFYLTNKADPIAKNATVVNGEQLGAEQRCRLNHGDVVTMGTVELKFSAS